MTDRGEYHRDAALVGRGNHLGIADAASRLNDGDRAVVGDHIEAVTEWKERVGRRHRPGKVQNGGARLDRGDARRIDAAHLTGTDAERLSVPAIDDRVALHE